MSDDIRIPADLLPADGRFGSGPSKVRREQVSGLLDVTGTYMGTSHRQKTVKSQVGRLRGGLSQLFSLPEGYEVVLGNGGSTAFWDIATFGLLRDRAQFLSFGEFGAKFAQAAKEAPHLGDPSVIKAEPGDAPMFRAEEGIDAYCSPHNETSTGVIVTPQRVPGADGDALVIFDATSGAGGLPLDPTQVDVYYFAPQKSFGSDGGLWFALMSPAAIARVEEIKATGRWTPAFFDLTTAIDKGIDRTNEGILPRLPGIRDCRHHQQGRQSGGHEKLDQGERPPSSPDRTTWGPWKPSPHPDQRWRFWVMANIADMTLIRRKPTMTAIPTIMTGSMRLVMARRPRVSSRS